LGVAITQVTDIDYTGDWVQKNCTFRACSKAKATTVASFSIHPYYPDLPIPGEGISLTRREAFLTLVAE
jgi:hypothetical protein